MKDKRKEITYRLTPLYKKFLDGFKIGNQIGNDWGKFYTIKKSYTGTYIDIDKDKLWNWINQNYVSKEEVMGLKMEKIYSNVFGRYNGENKLIDEFNHSIDKVINLLNKKDE